MTKQIRASHILVDSASQAAKLYDQIRGGKDFSVVAKKFSTCPSGKKGGDLGYFRKGQMVKPFEDAAFAANKGDLVGPVQTQFGWHIILVTDKR